MTGRRAVFVDKDGTLVRDVPFNVDPALIALMPGVARGARALHDAGFALVVVSNQPGVAMGLFSRHALDAVEFRLAELLADAGAVVSGCFWCTHTPATTPTRPAACGCRKPQPGLILAAAAAHAIDLARSWMVGDILDDIEAGHRAGCRAILVDRGGETEWRPGRWREPEAIVTRFDRAARYILASEARERAADARACA